MAGRDGLGPAPWAPYVHKRDGPGAVTALLHDGREPESWGM